MSMSLLEKMEKRYSQFYRKYLCLTQDRWFHYARTFPIVGVAMRNVAHPVLGKTLRRLFRFEGEGRLTQSHIVPINQKLSFQGKDKNKILPIDMVRNVIEDSSYRIIMNRCICRDGFECTDFPRDLGCIMLGEACRNMVARGVARYATVEECHEHLDKVVEKGLVAICAWAEFETIVKGIPEEEHRDYFEICFCCPCCCLGLRNYSSIMESEHMRKIFKSIGWRAKGTDDCVGCGACIKACPVDVIELRGDTIAVGDKCIGCGLCAIRCPEEAIVMEETEPMKDNILDYFWGFQPRING